MNVKELARNEFRTLEKEYFMLCDWQEEGRVGKGGLKFKGQEVEIVHFSLFSRKQNYLYVARGQGIVRCVRMESFAMTVLRKYMPD